MKSEVGEKDARLTALVESNLLDSQAEERFDRITRIVARALDVPVALVSLVDADRQFFKSSVGLPERFAECRETPLSHSFCQHVVAGNETLRVDDARVHELVADNLAVRDLSVVAYLGVPLRAPSGHVLGSLCAIDSKPRAWTPADESILRDLAAIVEEQIGLSAAERRWHAILNTMPQMVWSTLPNGSVDFYNRRWYEFTGVPAGSTDGDAWLGIIHADDRTRSVARWQQSVTSGEPYDIEYRLWHHSGEYRWSLGRALPIRDSSGAIERWFGTCTDIDDLKTAQSSRDLIARELSHRIQNIFTVVSSLVSMSARTEPTTRDFADTVRSRILALAHAHKYIRPDAIAAHGAAQFEHDRTLHGLIETVLAPYADRLRASRLRVEGADAEIDLRAATGLALTLHELATNAVKYGALSAEEGTLSVSCAETNDMMVITWRERGGPIVTEQPARSGFGSELVVTAAVTQLGAKLDRHWDREGLTVEISIPRATLHRGLP